MFYLLSQAQGSGLPDSPSQQRKQLRSDQSKTERSRGERERGGEESREDPMRKQLNTYIKRVAELETRIEELTIRAEVCNKFYYYA